MARDGTVWKREQPQRGRFAEHNVLRREGGPTTFIKSRANRISDVFYELFGHHSFENIIKYTLFQVGRFTEDQIGQLTQLINNGFQFHPVSWFLLTLFDFSRAFDRVWRNSLLLKLQQLGPPRCAHHWLGNFLSGQQCPVDINGTLSRPRLFHDGLPQGSSLSP